MEATHPLALSPKGVSTTTGMGITSIYDEIRKGNLKARKYGHKTLILHEDLKRFLESLPVMGSDEIEPVRTPNRHTKRPSPKRSEKAA